MENTESKALKVYEIGYILLPSIPAEKVGAAVDAIKALVTKQGGNFIAEEFPKLRPLAYTMQKQVGAVRHKVNEGYFGWVKFDVSPDAMTAIKAGMDTNNQVLRYLLITTVRENTYLGQKAALVAKDEVKTEDASDTASLPADEATGDDIDKTIDDMVKEA